MIIIKKNVDFDRFFMNINYKIINFNKLVLKIKIFNINKI